MLLTVTVLDPWLVAVIALVGVSAMWQLRYYAVPIHALYNTVNRYKAPYKAIQMNEEIDEEEKAAKIDLLFVSAVDECLLVVL